MRVLHCIYDDPGNPWLGGGGAERVWEIYRRLADVLDVTVLAGAYPGARTGPREGVRYEFAGLRRPYALSRLSYARAATARLRAGDYDAAVFDFSVYTPLRIPRDRPVGHVVHMPIGPRALDRWGRLLGGVVQARERAMFREVRRLSTTSRWMAAQLEPLLPSDATVRIVRSGVAPEFFDVRRAEADHLLFYGRFDWFQKGLDVLLGAADRLLAIRPDLELVLAGRGKDLDRVAAELARHPRSDRIRLVASPTREAVRDLMAGALALLHPSRFEGFPVVPAEAMAAGVPVVATAVGAVDEIIQGPDEGVLIAPDDADALVAAVARLLDDPGARARISRGARTGARRLGWDQVARDHRAFLEEVAAGG